MGLQASLKNVAKEALALVNHEVALLKVMTIKNKQHLKLHVGCGPFPKPGWVNIDQCREADLRLDLRHRFPFYDNSVEMVYSEHVFEHMTYPHESFHFLHESLRVLKPGGVFSMGIPDSEWAVKAYVNGDTRYYELATKQWHPSECHTRMQHLNYHFRQGGEHKYAYDFETLSQVLKEAGFTAIERRDFNSQLDSELRREGTIYIDAKKP